MGADRRRRVRLGTQGETVVAPLALSTGKTSLPSGLRRHSRVAAPSNAADSLLVPQEVRQRLTRHTA